MQEQDFTIIKKASIRPNKICFYSQVLRNNKQAPAVTKTSPTDKIFLNSIGVITLTESKEHNLILSDKAKKRIQEKVLWLDQFAIKKNVTSISGKIIHNFKLNFITLTLPSKQAHTTKEITNRVLNQFITELREKKGLKNYVWKMEYQNNGNCHYHLVTDAFIDYWYIKRVWNRCLEKLNYITEYAKKFEKMTFVQYYGLYKSEKNTFEVLKDRYISSKKTGFRQPNTVDVKAVTDSKNIASYIAKYITKNEVSKITEEIKEREKDSHFRLWFCSRELSKLNAIEVFIDCISDDVLEFFSNVKDAKIMLFDYVEMWYYSSKKQNATFKHFANRVFNTYREEVNFTPS